MTIHTKALRQCPYTALCHCIYTKSAVFDGQITLDYSSVVGTQKPALVLTNDKGISSMKLHRTLGIRQPSVWFLLHRIWEAIRTVLWQTSIQNAVPDEKVAHLNGLDYASSVRFMQSTIPYQRFLHQEWAMTGTEMQRRLKPTLSCK